MGGGIVAAIAGKLALGAGTVGDAIGYALPKLVGALMTTGGAVPKTLPSSVTGLLETPPLLPRALNRPVVAQIPAKSSAGLWAVPFLLLVGVGLLTYYYPRLYQTYYPLYKDKYPFLSLALPPAPEAAGTEQAAASPPAAAPAAPVPAPSAAATAPEPAPAPPAPAPAPSAPAQLKLEQANGVLTYGGSVDSAASRDLIIALLTAQFGADHIKGDLSVDFECRLAELAGEPQAGA